MGRMYSFLDIWFWQSVILIVLFGAVLPNKIMPGGSSAGKGDLTARLPLGLEENWENQLETGLIALEANCDQNYIPFNREKVRDDLKACLRVVIAEDTTDSYRVFLQSTNPGIKKPSQIDLFRHIYVEPVCNKISQSLACLQPHRKILETCAREDGKALRQLMNVACKGNGSRIIEFLEMGGIDCLVEQREAFLHCFSDLAHRKANLTSSDEICRYFGEVRECLTGTLYSCKNQKPAEVIHSLLEEVAGQTKGSCFHSISSVPKVIGIGARLTSDLYLFFSLIYIPFLLMRTN